MAQSIIEESKQAKRGVFRVLFKKKNIIIIVSVLILASGAWYYFSGRSSKSQAATVQVKQSIVKQEDLKISIESSGKVVAKDGVELSFPVSGNLEVSDVYVKEGDKIKKGDKIAAV
jgi:multidrug efflux pump subunit AcrA (membrane-fusion protein)